MRAYLKSFLTAGAVLISAGLLAQEVSRPDVLARLSYDSAATGQGEDVRSICVAVSPAGNYRVVRTLENGRMERKQGRIPSEEFQELRKTLFSAAFRGLAGHHGGMIRQQAEIFAAELPVSGDKTQRLQWLNADDDNPFPGPVEKIVSWLKNFEPKNGKEFEYSEFSDVCPTAELRLVQPAVAANSKP